MHEVSARELRNYGGQILDRVERGESMTITRDGTPVAMLTPPIPFDAACARRFAMVAANLRESGRKTRARAFDALIASAALAHGISLYTCTARDFEGIGELEIHSVSPDPR